MYYQTDRQTDIHLQKSLKKENTTISKQHKHLLRSCTFLWKQVIEYKSILVYELRWTIQLFLLKKERTMNWKLEEDSEELISLVYKYGDVSLIILCLPTPLLYTLSCCGFDLFLLSLRHYEWRQYFRRPWNTWYQNHVITV